MGKSHGGSLISATILNEKRSSTLSLGYCDLGLSHADSHEIQRNAFPRKFCDYSRIWTKNGLFFNFDKTRFPDQSDKYGPKNKNFSAIKTLDRPFGQQYLALALIALLIVNPKESLGPTKWMFRNAAKN